MKINKKILYKYYIKQNKTMKETCKYFGIGHKKLWTLLRKYNINKRTPYNILTKEFLYKEYITNKKSMRQIAKKLGVSIQKISYNINKFKIKKRTLSEATLLLDRNGENNSNYKYGKYCKNRKNKCKICNKKINNWAVYCDKCKYQKHSQLMKKQGNPNWKGGINKEPYAFNWTEELKEIIRKRDNHICQLCGLTEEEHILMYNRFLAIHHIDYNKKNCKENNLITLCIHCNSRVNFNREYWAEYFQSKIEELKLL